MSTRSDVRMQELLASMASIAGDLSVSVIIHRVLDEAMKIFSAGSGLLELTNASHQQGNIAMGPDAAGLLEPAGKDEAKRLRLEVTSREEHFARLTLGPKNGKDRYSKADRQLGMALAGSAGVALENAQLYQDAADRARWLAACAKIGGLLGGESPHHTQGLNDVAELARRESGAKYALLLTPITGETETSDGYRIAGISAHVHPHLAGRVLMDVGVRHHLVLRNNHPLVLTTPEPILPLGELADGRATLVTELSARGSHYGLMVTIREEDAGHYRPVEVQMAGVFSDNIAQGLGLVQMHHLREEVLLYLERERIARDLHDIVIQRIFAAGLGISALRKQLPTEDARQRATGIAGELDTTIGELRATIYALRTNAGQKETPSSRILRAIRLASEPLAFTPTLRLGDDLDALTNETTLAHLLAVISEGLSNVVRHARASTVELAVERGPRTLVFTLRDDGAGFQPGGRESGLANMRQRALELGGMLVIESSRGNGTTLRWSVPLSGGG
ncbi:MAG: histidine kinase [Micrococcaceae bacterium]|nr:histidine kinase [Micrococcaceae bacterium]